MSSLLYGLAARPINNKKELDHQSKFHVLQFSFNLHKILQNSPSIIITY